MILAAGCDRSDNHELRDYLSRVARPLGETPGTPVSPPLPLPPRWEALQVPLESGSLNGLDFLRLRGCTLQQAVARRNSSLGRLAPPSQRLLLDLDFMRLAPGCIDLLEDRDEMQLARTLRKSLSQKQRQLPAAIFNATLGNQEYRDLWRPDGRQQGYPENTSTIVVEDLRAVAHAARRWLAGHYDELGQELELHLGGIARGDGGELLVALAQQSAYLDRASALLNDRAATGGLCRAGLQPQTAVILRNVARRFFIGALQPRAAALERRRQMLLPPIRELEELLTAALPSQYQRWQGERDAALAHWRAAPKRHVRGLQALLGSCFDEFAPAG